MTCFDYWWWYQHLSVSEVVGDLMLLALLGIVIYLTFSSKGNDNGTE